MRTFWVVLLMLSGFSGAFAQSGTSEPIESGVTLRMSAPVTVTGERKFLLGISTNDVYECKGTFIENEVHIQGTTLLIKLKNVRVPANCEAQMGPAVANIDLSSLKPGNYPIRVTINRQVFKADLEITPNYYNLVLGPEDPMLFRTFNGRLNLIPSNSVWGVCSYTRPEQRDLALKFMKELEAAGAQPTNLPAGNYDDFYLHETGKTQEKEVARSRYEFPFVYNFSGNLEVVKEILNSYQGKLDITYLNSRGLAIRNF
jgi:hypothetical protein